jgi:hypothetical protein
MKRNAGWAFPDYANRDGAFAPGPLAPSGLQVS